MKKIKQVSAIFALTLSLASCGDNDVLDNAQNQEDILPQSEIRSIDEAYDIAAKSLIWLDAESSRGEVRYLTSKSDIKILKNKESRSDSNDTLMYVINFVDEKGFAIVPANRNMPELLAVVENGSYDPNKTTEVEPFNDYMSFAVQSIGGGGITDPGKDDNKPVPMEEWKAVAHETVNSHHGLKSSYIWGEDGIEGKYFSNHRCGCGVLTAALTMAYFKYPQSIQLTYNNNSTLALNWSSLVKHDSSKNVYSGTTFVKCNDELIAADQEKISKLCKEIGARALAVCKNDKKTSVTVSNLANALSSFGFSVTANVSLDERITTDSITYIPYAQNKSGEWHMWVIDGYKYITVTYAIYKRINDPNLGIKRPWEYISSRSENNEYVHHNWGWNGKYNGWFSVGFWVSNKGHSYDNGDTPEETSQAIYSYMDNHNMLTIKRESTKPGIPDVEI